MAAKHSKDENHQNRLHCRLAPTTKRLGALFSAVNDKPEGKIKSY